MNQGAIELTGAITRAGVNFLVQSSVVIAVALLAGRFAARTAAVRSAIYRATLVALGLLPAVGFVLSVAGVSFVSLPFPVARLVPVAPDTMPLQARRSAEVLEHSAPASLGSEGPLPIPEETGAEGAFVAAPVQETFTPPERALEETATRRAAPARQAVVRPNSAACLYAAFALLWAVGALLMLAHLALCHVWLMRVRARAQPMADRAVLDELSASSAKMGVRAPGLLLSRRIRSPLLTGFFRPAIVLPAEEEALSAGQHLRATLVHELAHLSRRDCLWNLLARVLCAAAFFQPLVRVLTRRMEEASDEVADDAVLSQGVAAPSYARALTDLAARFVPSRRESTAGLGVIRFRTAIGRRISRILDLVRPREARVSKRTIIGIALAAFAICSVVALVVIGRNPVSVSFDGTVRRNFTADDLYAVHLTEHKRANPVAVPKECWPGIVEALDGATDVSHYSRFAVAMGKNLLIVLADGREVYLEGNNGTHWICSEGARRRFPLECPALGKAVANARILIEAAGQAGEGKKTPAEQAPPANDSAEREAWGEAVEGANEDAAFEGKTAQEWFALFCQPDLQDQQREYAGFALLMLGRAAVPVLRSGLGHEDADVRAGAASLLGEFGAAARGEVLQGLRAALGDADAHVRIFALMGLTRLDAWAPEDAALLAQLAQSAEDRGGEAVQACFALGALGQRAPDVVVPVLVRIVRGRDDNLRYQAVEALSRMGSKAAAAVPDLVQLLREGDDGYRHVVLAALGSIGPAARDALPHVQGMLSGESIQTRLWAHYAAAKITEQSPAHVAALVKALHSEDINRHLAALVLGTLNAEPELAVPALRGALEDEGRVVRYAAEALGKFGTVAEPSVSKLLELARHEDAQVRRSAVEALSRISADDHVVQSIAERLGDPGRSARVVAAEALARLSSDSKLALQALRVAARSDDLTVALPARLELSRLEAKPASTTTDEPTGADEPRTAADAPWGEAVEGVQVRLRAEKTVWQFGETPTLKLDLRNDGERLLGFPPEQTAEYGVELDGQWYFRADKVKHIPVPLPPGGRHEGVSISLHPNGWVMPGERESEIESLQLAPGKHVVRVRAMLFPIGSDKGKTVRGVVSNPVEITIERALPANKLSIEEAMTVPGFAFAAMCEPLDDGIDVTWTRRPLTTVRLQRFRVVEALVGRLPEGKTFRLRYVWSYRADIGERSPAAEEKAIWVVGKPREALPHYWLGIKTFSDTPENRKAVIEALKAKRDGAWSSTQAQMEALRSQIREAREPDAQARLKLALGKALRRLWREERSLSQPRKGEQDDPLQHEVHAKRATEAQAQAIATLRDVWQNHPDTRSAAEALFYLGVLYEESRMHAECVEACQALLDTYPDAEIPSVVGKRHQFNVYNRMGHSLAALGRREEATGAFVDSLLAAKTDRYWRSGIRTLLRHESRFATKDYRQGLPKAAQDALLKAKKEAGLVVELSPDVLVVARGQAIEIGYKIQKRTELPLTRDYCLAFEIVPAGLEIKTQGREGVYCTPFFRHGNRSSYSTTGFLRHGGRRRDAGPGD